MFKIMFLSNPAAILLQIVEVVLCLLSLGSNVLASPLPLPLAFSTPDYSLGFVSLNRSTRPVLSRKLSTLSSVSSNFSEKYSRDLPERDDRLAYLTQCVDGADENAGTLRNLAADSENTDGMDDDFQQRVSTQLLGFNTHMHNFQEALATEGITTDRGLANYDRQNDVETLLKKLLNANKDLLSSTTTIVYNIPEIGPVLGPIVYDIKCLVDGLLDVTEDVFDALVNALGPTLRALLGKASDAVCKSGAEVVGLCV